MKGVWVLNRIDKIWFSLLSVIGIVFLLVGLILLFSLLMVGSRAFPAIGAQWGNGSWLVGIGFFFLVLAWFVASSESDRVLRICFLFGITSLVVSTVLSATFMVDPMAYLLIAMSGFGLVGGSVFALFYKVSRAGNHSATSRR